MKLTLEFDFNNPEEKALYDKIKTLAMEHLKQAKIKTTGVDDA